MFVWQALVNMLFEEDSSRLFDSFVFHYEQEWIVVLISFLESALWSLLLLWISDTTAMVLFQEDRCAYKMMELVGRHDQEANHCRLSMCH